MIAAQAITAWYLPACVSSARPLTSPTAYSQSACDGNPHPVVDGDRSPASGRSSPGRDRRCAACARRRPAARRNAAPRRSASVSVKPRSSRAALRGLRAGADIDPQLPRGVDQQRCRERLRAWDQPRRRLDLGDLWSRASPTPGRARSRPRRRRAPSVVVGHRRARSSRRGWSTARSRAGRRSAGSPRPSRPRSRPRRAASSTRSPTVTRRSPSSRPWPRTSVIPLSSSHGSCASSLRSWITASRRRAPVRRRRSPVTASRAPGIRASSASACAGPQQRLGRHARPVGALAADQLPLDDADVEALAGQPPGADLAGRARPEHDHVVALGRGHPAHLVTTLRAASRSRPRTRSRAPSPCWG